MPARPRKRHSRSPLPPPNDMLTPRQRPLSPGVSTSLDSVHITPRTPHAVRPTHAGDSAEADDFVGGLDAEEVEMNLLGEDERRRARPGFAGGDRHLHVMHKAPLSLEDKRAMVLLCVLCTSLFSFSLVSRLYHRPCSQT